MVNACIVYVCMYVCMYVMVQFLFQLGAFRFAKNACIHSGTDYTCPVLSYLFTVYLTTLSVAQIASNERMIEHYKLERMLKEVAVA
jgi:hypothetical protein